LKTKPPVEKTLLRRFFFDAFCTIRNAFFLETLCCQTHPASIDFIDMPLDFKPSLPAREACTRDDFRCASAKITRFSGVTALTQPLVKLPTWFAPKAGGMGVHFLN